MANMLTFPRAILNFLKDQSLHELVHHTDIQKTEIQQHSPKLIVILLGLLVNFFSYKSQHNYSNRHKGQNVNF